MTSPQETRNRSRTKIVATVGPACEGREQLARLFEAGADVFRLNMAHATPDVQQRHLDDIRSISAETGEPIAVLVDLAGPKIRLGEISGERRFCEIGEEFILVSGDGAGSPNELTVTYEPLVDELQVGNRVMLADGTVAMEAVAKEPGRVRLRVVDRGTIRSRQGINLPGITLGVPTISETDRANAIWAAKAGVDFIGLSFVRSPNDVRELKDIVRSCDSESRVVAKIEKREALAQLNEIVAESQGVMVARGDLGVEIDVARMPMEQKRIIGMCHRLRRPVIIATQMLDSMQDSPRPTRAEATDVANAILDGADACMLSGETAVGKYPQEAVAMMNRIALATEASFQGRLPKLPQHSTTELHNITQAVVRAAGQMAHDLEAKLVFVASHSGRTALALSQHRSFVPTMGGSSSEATLRQMCLYWGVRPLRGAPAHNMQELIRHADKWSCHEGYTKKGDSIVIVGGSHLTAGPNQAEMASGVHDVLLVHRIEGCT
jgi:pyruvate kinase